MMLTQYNIQAIAARVAAAPHAGNRASKACRGKLVLARPSLSLLLVYLCIGSATVFDFFDQMGRKIGGWVRAQVMVEEKRRGLV